MSRFLLVIAAALAALPAGAETVAPKLAPGEEGAWLFREGRWHMGDGVLEQESVSRGSAAILKAPALTDFVLTAEFRIAAEGNGVRAAALLFRATGTLSYYWLHLDSKNRQAILVRSTPGNNWLEVKRVRVPIAPDQWHAVQFSARGNALNVRLDGNEILAATDSVLPAGRVGLGTSQGQVSFRSIKIVKAFTNERQITDAAGESRSGSLDERSRASIS